MRLVFLVVDLESKLELLEQKPGYLVTDVAIDLTEKVWSEVGREWRKPTPIGQLRDDGRAIPGSVLAVIDLEDFRSLATVIHHLGLPSQ